MMNWMRVLRSGQEVSYNDMPFKEVVALALSLDEWEIIIDNRLRNILLDKQRQAK